MRGFFHKHLEYNQKSEIKLKTSWNFAHQDEHHLGFYFEHDTKDFKRLWAQAAWTPKEKNHRGAIRADIQNHFVSVVGMHKHGADIIHAYEATYDAAEGAKGFYGLPIGFRAGAEYKYSPSTHMKSAFWLNEHYGTELKVEHKVDDHWSVSTHQEFCSSLLKAKQGPHNLGFKVNYKL